MADDARDAPLLAFGRELAGAQDARLRDEIDLRSIRGAVLAVSESPRAPRSRRTVPLMGGAMLLAAAAAVVFWLRAPEGPGFTVGGAAGAIGVPIHAVARPVSIGFAGQGELTLSPYSAIELDEVSSAVVRVRLHRGQVAVDLTQQEGTRWWLTAGPYRVELGSTRLRLGWDAVAHALEVDVAEGAVWVTGPQLAEPRRVSAGEALQLRGIGMPVAEPEVAAMAGIPESAVEVPAAAPVVAASTRPRGRGRGDRQVPVPRDPDWRELAAVGQYRAALEAASRTGLDRAMATAVADDLVLLADVARFSGQTSTSETVLETLRRRFPGTSQAALAAFQLGRIAFDVRHEHGRSAGWFTTYLEESPTGRFRQEALGRLFVAEHRGARDAAARRAAQRYLAEFPRGPHAAAARQALAR